MFLTACYFYKIIFPNSVCVEDDVITAYLSVAETHFLLNGFDGCPENLNYLSKEADDEEQTVQ